MTQIQPNCRTTWFFKLCESALAATALLNLLLFPLEFMPAWFFEKYGQYFGYVLMASVMIALLASLIHTGIWHRREQGTNPLNALHHASLQGIIRYWLALSISTYGFAKILKTQFQTADYRLDMLLSSVDGMGLTWYYYGYSYPVAVIIGIFQIGGSILLLYRRTTLLGVVILLPVMVNIVLINVFYKISMGALFNSVIYSLALVFLLLLNFKKLKVVFWEITNQLPPISLAGNWTKNSLRISLIGFAFLSLKILIINHPSDQILKGSWRVEKLTRNGQVLSHTAWLTNNTAWSRIYFAGYEGCAFSPNPYRFDPGESMQGSYEFDSLRNTLQVIFYSHDTLKASIKNRSAESMQLLATLGRDTLDMELTRIKR